MRLIASPNTSPPPTNPRIFSFDASLEAANDLRARGFGRPDICIVLGSGLGSLAERVNITAEAAYRDIPHFPTSSVAGHRGRLLFGTLAGRSVLLMDGRVHAYEGYGADDVVFPARVMWQLGGRILLVTNDSAASNCPRDTAFRPAR